VYIALIDKSAKHENERLVFIQNSLKRGLDREKIASLLGYKNWRGLDIYMRRQGMKWDSNKNAYYFATDSLSVYDNTPNLASPKAARIISRFNDRDADPRQIASEMGFKDHRELASFMAARGFVWSNEQKNYIPNKNYISKGDQTDSQYEESSAFISEFGESSFNQMYGENLEKYIPLFEILIKYKDRLLNLLLPSSSPGTIPRYAIPGVTRTKSFYMSDSLSKLISEFSERNNISQKEIIEAAVIEFLRRHSFGREVDAMLGKTIH
jgi:hypothetical protein